MSEFGRLGVAFSRFLDSGVTSIHSATSIEVLLRESGFIPFSGESAKAGAVKPGSTGYLRRGGTVLAYRAGTAPPEEGGLLIGAAHTDSPGLQLKPRSARYADGMLMVPVEVYGGPLLATWIDRDLTIAGHLGLRSGRLVPIAPARALATIPNLAIHFNREANDSLSYNKQDHLQALFGPVDRNVRETRDAPQEFLRRCAFFAGAASGIGEHADEDAVLPEDILDMEVNLVPVEPAVTTAEGLVFAPRIDNLAGCFTLLEAFRGATPETHSQIALFFDHEEIGSTTAYGAAGAVTEQFLRRFVRSLDPTATLETVLQQSALISNDGAHARHPNYQDKHDAGYAPVLGGGPVVKKSAVRRYASELSVSTWLARIAARAGVPLQYLQNRSDIAAGSTIAPAVASRLAIPSVDIGIPMLGMHSIRETAALADIDLMTKLLTQTYKGSLHEVFDTDPSRES